MQHTLPSSSALDRILQLSRFDDDSSAALRALHQHFSARFPNCSLALALVRGVPIGQCRLAGLIAPDGREHVPNVDPYGQDSVLSVFDDALANDLFSSIEARRISICAAEQGLPLDQALFAAHALLGVPLVNSGEITHWLIFGNSVSGFFDALNLDEVLVEVNLAASLVVRPIATRALREEGTRQRQVIEGLADVQRLLQPENPKILGLDHAIHWQPADTAAGDYYDLTNLTHHAPADFPRDQFDIWAVTLADVSGHGAAAAVEAVQLDAILRTYQGNEESGPAGALTYANRHFFSRRTRHHFLTAIALLYRPDLRRAIYVSAGHPALLHRHGNHVTARTGGEQIPLGVLRDYEWANHEFEAHPGDVLVLYTDGIIEARDSAGKEFGGRRLSEIIAHGPSEPNSLLELLLNAVFRHQGSAIGIDDQTLIVLKIN